MQKPGDEAGLSLQSPRSSFLIPPAGLVGLTAALLLLIRLLILATMLLLTRLVILSARLLEIRSARHQRRIQSLRSRRYQVHRFQQKGLRSGRYIKTKTTGTKR
jgi:hypothetical protein